MITRPTRLPVFTTGVKRFGRWQRLTCVLLTTILLLPVTALAATPAGTIVSNIASADYKEGTGLVVSTSSQVNFLVTADIPSTTAEIRLLQLDESSGTTQVPLTTYSSDGTTGGALIDILPQPLPGTLVDNAAYHVLDRVIVELTDLDENVNPLVAEQVFVSVRCDETGDQELLQLTESDLDTGVFIGYLPADSTAPLGPNGVLSVIQEFEVIASYTDKDDGDSIETDKPVDPFGIVFDSSTGAPLNSVEVSIVLNDGFNTPATVYADASRTALFPSTVTTGDSTLGFIAGGFRFPFIDPGNYRLLVTQPAGYAVPSSVPEEVIQTLPGAPFAIDASASYGGAFAVNPGPAIHIDIPIDPVSDNLWMTKMASRNDVSAGDFLQYTLAVENNNSLAATADVTVEDILPKGFRYQPGSLRIDGSKAGDPALAKDGRTLQFNIGDIPPASRVEITYVVEIAAGSRPGKAENFATATDAIGNTSNTAVATVTVREDFFSNSTILAGRVFDGSCETPDTQKPGLGNVRIYLEDGTYVDTDEAGKYHFEGVEPGVHVVQVDTTTLPTGYEMIPCELSSQFAGRTFSQFVDLQGGTLWNVSFYAAPATRTTGGMTLTMDGRLDKDSFAYHLELNNQTVPASNLRLTVMLPAQTDYRPGSSRMNGHPVADPVVHGDAMIYEFAEAPQSWNARLEFFADIDPAVAAGELVTKTVLVFDTPSRTGQRTPIVETVFRVDDTVETIRDDLKLYPHFPTFVAALQAEDIPMLSRLVSELEGQKIVQVSVVGHTDNQAIAPRSRHIFADNFALSRARAQSVADYLLEHLGISAEQISIKGMADTLPVADNTSSAGQARNRRVDLTIQTKTSHHSTEIKSIKPKSRVQSTLTGTGAEQAIEPSQDQTATKTTVPGFQWPEDGAKLAQSSSPIRFQIDSRLQPRLTLDGQPIPEDRLGMKAEDQESGLTFYSYVAVDFGEPGTHLLKLEGIGPFGNARFEETVTVIRNSDIAEIKQVDSVVNVADGRTPVVAQLALTDSNGEALATRLDLYLQSKELRPLGLPEDQYASYLLENRQLTIELQQDGTLQFEPVMRSGLYEATVRYGDITKELKINVKPHLRDWILVGFAEGTVGYNHLSGNEVSLDKAGIDEHYYDNGRVKFFAKGAIKGEWLLTMAYDSDKPDLDGESLHQIIDPDTYYPLYGDASRLNYEAASASDIYLKLEKDQAYALFGDMSTDLRETVLAQYNRNLNGLKVEQQAENYSIKAFAAETSQTFAKDEIRGDGTSGRYQLSNNSLVINSEQVVIETRGRLHSEMIVNLETLSRHTDYEIDYNSGSLYFKRPIPSKDEDFNPVFIVVRYEVEGSTGKNYVYGGRIAVSLLDHKLEVGVTYVHDEEEQGEGDLYSVDATIQLNEKTELHLEVARTETEEAGQEMQGDAYLAELVHTAEETRVWAYYREQAEDFGLGQLNDSETGMRKYGAAIEQNVSPKVSIGAEVFHEDDLETDAKRDVVEAQGTYQGDGYQLRAGARHVEDELQDGTKQQSTQALVGADWDTSIKGVKLHADFEQLLNNDKESEAYPTLLRLGADYLVSERIRLFADQEFTWGDEDDTQATRAGVALTPWEGGAVETSLEQQIDENSQRMFALFGLEQTWQINEQWAVSTSLDRSQTLTEKTSDSVNNDAPAAHGTEEDFTSLSVGATYTNGKLAWSNRLETRQADSENKYGAISRIVAQVQDGIAVSAKASIFITEPEHGASSNDGLVSLGMAYRPDDSRWIILERFDFEFVNEPDYNSRRMINHLHANWKMNRKVQFSLYSGVKYVYETHGGETYDGITDMYAVETRYNINSRWDVGAHASSLHSWNDGNFEYAAGLSIGYMVRTNIWVSLGYNIEGYEDPDFSEAHYTTKGPYLRFRMKFDQQSVREAVDWLNR